MTAPNPYADYQRTGMDKMLKLAKVLCRLVADFEVIIKAVFPDSTAIQALLVAVKSVCSLLPEAETEFVAWELDTALPPADPAETGGINPNAPAPVPPDIT